MFTVYILKSTLRERHYIGFSSDLEERLSNHNRGSNKSTKPYRPWILVYTEKYLSKTDALKREKQIKAYKGGDAFKQLLK